MPKRPSGKKPSGRKPTEKAVPLLPSKLFRGLQLIKPQLKDRVGQRLAEETENHSHFLKGMAEQREKALTIFDAYNLKIFKEVMATEKKLESNERNLILLGQKLAEVKAEGKPLAQEKQTRGLNEAQAKRFKELMVRSQKLQAKKKKAHHQQSMLTIQSTVSLLQMEPAQQKATRILLDGKKRYLAAVRERLEKEFSADFHPQDLKTFVANFMHEVRVATKHQKRFYG